MNLYEETMAILKEHDKTFDDVIAICGGEFQITKDNFIECSNTEYDNGFGAPEVATDLVIVGVDFWLERHEYDGSEWWEFKSMPKYKHLPFKRATALTIGQAKRNGVRCSCGWEDLKTLQVGRDNKYAEN